MPTTFLLLPLRSVTQKSLCNWQMFTSSTDKPTVGFHIQLLCLGTGIWLPKPWRWNRVWCLERDTSLLQWTVPLVWSGKEDRQAVLSHDHRWLEDLRSCRVSSCYIKWKFPRVPCCSVSSWAPTPGLKLHVCLAESGVHLFQMPHSVHLPPAKSGSDYQSGHCKGLIKPTTLSKGAFNLELACHLLWWLE